jgi:hypothetical protein
MEAKTLKTPVAMFVFNRPETTRKVFEVIARARPDKLLLVADGPRLDRPGEAERCAEVREVVSHVDWQCQVLTNFSNTNLGCQERMISGINWVFSLVEEAIFLEDDCLPDVSFFFFCQELLETYRGDSRVAAISGTNLVEKQSNMEASYYFSRLGGNWGWASWKSSWQRYDRYLRDWPELKGNLVLSDIFNEPGTVSYWTAIFDEVHAQKRPTAWDYQWVYTHLRDNTVTAVPRLNLVQNIGFGEGGTHTSYKDERFPDRTGVMQFPLTHPKSIAPSSNLDRQFQNLYNIPLRQRLSRKIRQFIK